MRCVFHFFVWFCGVLVSISSPNLLRCILENKFDLSWGLGDVDALIPVCLMPTDVVYQDIENELGLTREQLIRMALLLGSDYTEGVRYTTLVISSFHVLP